MRHFNDDKIFDDKEDYAMIGLHSQRNEELSELYNKSGNNKRENTDSFYKNSFDKKSG